MMNDLMRDSIASDLMRDAVVHDLMRDSIASDLRRTDKIDIEGDFQAPSGLDLDLAYAKIKTGNISKGTGKSLSE